ncbi:MAG: hypothetical protein HYZ47_04020, partial [Simkania negevensis]|nr:hypothetical protein [Simkania negevensis]
MKICLKACAVFLAFLFSTIIHASPCSIHIEDEQDYKVLDRFFKMGFSHEEYGYVLEGDKPISVRSFYSLRDFPITKDIKYAEKEFANSLLIQEVIPIWNRLCSHQKSFVLKATPLDGR